MKRTGAFGCGLFFLEFGITFFILSYSLPLAFPDTFSPYTWGAMGFFIGGVVCCLIGVPIIIAIPASSSGSQKTEERKAFGRSLNLKNTVIGMTKAEGRVNMRFLSSNMAMLFDDFKIHLYDLLGQDLLEGTVNGDYFIPTGDISAAIDLLFQEFAKWEGGKKV